MASGVRIVPGQQAPVTVNISGPSAVYSDRALTQSVTLPSTISATTDYFFASPADSAAVVVSGTNAGGQSVLSVTQNFGGNQFEVLQAAPPAPGSTYESNLLSGTLALRPSASSVTAGALYFATDVAGGTLYKSDGISAWAPVAPGVTSVAGVELAYAETTIDPASSVTTLADVSGLTGITFTAPASGKVVIVGHVEGYDTVANDGILFIVVDSNSGTEYCRARNSGGNANQIEEMHAYRRQALTPGNSYTIKMQMSALTGGVAHFVTSASSPLITAFVHVLSC